MMTSHQEEIIYIPLQSIGKPRPISNGRRS